MRNFSRNIVGLFLALSIGAGSAAAHDPMRITLNKSKILRFTETLNTVIVGKSAIADAMVHSFHHLIISAKAVGETDLIVLSKTGKEVASFHLVVVPEVNRHVTVHKSPDTVATYSCAPRCTIVASPDGTELTTRSPERSSPASSGTGAQLLGTVATPAQPQAPQKQQTAPSKAK